MKKIFKILTQVLGILCVTFFLFEVCYRLYVIDFYKADLKGLNKKRLSSNKTDFLVFGDSFTAQNKYIQYLEKNTKKTFINAASSGIGIDEINLYATDRIKRFKPRKIIYQVYVGNDLIDVKNLTNYKKISLFRNLYWWLSDYFISLFYINKQLSLKQSDFKRTYIFDDTYDAKKYSNRSKLYFVADSLYLQKSILIEDDFVNRYDIWQKKIKKFIEKCDTIPVYVVLIPHNAQLNEKYIDRMQEIGGNFTQKNHITKNEYPFYQKTVRGLSKYKNVTILNSLTYFKEKDSIQPLYYANDPHLNDFGQQVLGEFLEQKIIQK